MKDPRQVRAGKPQSQVICGLIPQTPLASLAIPIIDQRGAYVRRDKFGDLPAGEEYLHLILQKWQDGRRGAGTLFWDGIGQSWNDPKMPDNHQGWTKARCRLTSFKINEILAPHPG